MEILLISIFIICLTFFTLNNIIKVAVYILKVIENKPGSKSHLYRFSVVCEDRSYEFSAQDMRTRSEWLRGMYSTLYY